MVMQKDPTVGWRKAGGIGETFGESHEQNEPRGKIRGSNFVRRFNNYSSQRVNHFAESVCVSPWRAASGHAIFARTNWPPGTEGLLHPFRGWAPLMSLLPATMLAVGG